jgi:prolyl-tRNA editing enzyme YbaK/EbsC (Cys-tRNA(Pro) deacylase)
MTSAPANIPEQPPQQQSKQQPEQQSGPLSEPARAAILAHPAVVRVREALTAVHVTTEVVVLDGAARTAAQAAAYLGVLPAQIANSLVFTVTAQDPDQPGSEASPELLLVLASGAHRVDTAKVADLLELESVEMASTETVREATGFVIGGMAPVGQLRPIRTLIDVSLARYDTVWAAAGHPRAVFATTYDELLRITGGQPIEAT